MIQSYFQLQNVTDQMQHLDIAFILQGDAYTLKFENDLFICSLGFITYN